MCVSVCLFVKSPVLSWPTSQDAHNTHKHKHRRRALQACIYVHTYHADPCIYIIIITLWVSHFCSILLLFNMEWFVPSFRMYVATILSHFNNFHWKIRWKCCSRQFECECVCVESSKYGEECGFLRLMNTTDIDEMKMIGHIVSRVLQENSF